MFLFLMLAVLALGLRRRRRLAAMLARYRARAWRSWQCATFIPDPWTNRPYPMPPEDVTR